MGTCENCKYSEPMVGALACMGQKGMPYVRPTDSCNRWKTMKQTNADHIRAMTNEELAEWIYQVQDGDAYQKENFLPPLSKSWWLDWLKQEDGDTDGN